MGATHKHGHEYDTHRRWKMESSWAFLYFDIESGLFGLTGSFDKLLL